MARSIRIYIKQFYRKCGINCLLFFSVALLTFVFYQRKSQILPIQSQNIEALEASFGTFFDGSPKNVERIKVDWQDHGEMEQDSERVGLGEHGEKAEFNYLDKIEMDEVFAKNGYNGMLSDKISVNRSVADIRHPDCHKKTYLRELPSVSVVIPMYDEHLSVLLRTVHSIINRSPKNLLKEIIIVDDCSTKDDLKIPLRDYVREHLPLVKIIRQPERFGLITGRLAGAKLATGDVLIFLDSHTETNYNWLPPLLEPIAENYKTCVCPFIDVIDANTFEYRSQDEGARGAFDWLYYYHRMPLFPKNRLSPTEIFESPVMAGGLFAISQKFFWELGGYDEGLDIWGGEQFELSFKIWMCGGQMYDAPCSRIGHVYRSTPFKKNPRTDDYITKNLKRVAEVWMDDYKEYIYNKSPKRWSIDPGNLSKQIENRKQLNCKSFKWFLETVAPDLIQHFPPVEPAPFMSGIIQNSINKGKCLDSYALKKPNRLVGITKCSVNTTHPLFSQMWHLSWRKDIRNTDNTCVMIDSSAPDTPLKLYRCSNKNFDHTWRYDEDKKWMIYDRFPNCCLELNEKTSSMVINMCDSFNELMKWDWGFINRTAMMDWDSKERMDALKF